MEVEKSPVVSKKRSVRSWVWEHFTSSSDNDEYATCNHCTTKVSGRNGTNKLKHHLLSAHQIIKPQDSTTVKSTKKMKLDDPQAASITTKLYHSCHFFISTELLERISSLRHTYLFRQSRRVQNLQNL